MYQPNQPFVNAYTYQQFFGVPTETVTCTPENVSRARASSSSSSEDEAPAKAVKPTKGKAKKSDGEGKKGKSDSSFSVEERIVASAWVHERGHTHTSMSTIRHQFEMRFGRPAPAKNTLMSWERKLFSSGTVHDAPRTGRPAKRQLEVNELSESLAAAPTLSIRARAAALSVPRSTLRALMRRMPGAPGAAAPAKAAKPKAPRKRAAPALPAVPTQPLF